MAVVEEDPVDLPLPISDHVPSDLRLRNAVPGFKLGFSEIMEKNE